ncbi:serine hydrolase domain-containing protein [Flagellimonas pacifica]|uniref:CubicO group peptidase, beta-lactamase class C family n=1 Tax=Flagellimonas pacifica TaxID=1247520 RepID=A0A285MUT4_9FLAO|nr:serine hydrolase domain-containing protein [Allomuricauda parva]SNZ00878.1 CubicO group peptidase, beta-lactamase class C family [Allomuricauda parva]
MKSLITLLKSFFTSNQIKSLEGLQEIQKANAMLHSLVVEAKVPGIAVTILKDGEVVLEKGYGYSNLEEKILVDPQNTKFRIASISKCITGIALGKMVEEGILELDTSFYTYVPYYPKKEHDFTIRQLAGHIAGIRGYRGKEFALNRSMSIKESIEIFKEDPLVFEPGKGYLYNSFDFVLLSLAMQEASGIPFDQYVKEKILDPLGMESTFPPYVVGQNGDHKESNKGEKAEFYTKTITGFKRAVAVNNQYKMAGGGYLSTSNDIAKLGRALLNQELVKAEILQEVFTSQKVNGEPTYYGLGFQISQDAYGRKFVGHVGNSVGAYSNFFVYPEQKVVVSILMNCTDPKIQTELDLINILFN